MSRIMYDSVQIGTNPGQIPKNGQIIAPYFDGPYAIPSIPFVEDHFPGQPINGITVTGRNLNARTFDVEPSDIEAGQLENLISNWREHDAARWEGGARPVVYCSVDTIPSVRVGTGKYILAKDYYLWVATLDGLQYTGPGVIACQAWDLGLYDKSVVYSNQFLPT